MDATLMAALLAKAKTTLRITTTAFDDEITDIINAGIQDLTTRGVIVSTESGSLNPLVLLALMTYVRFMFGDPTNPERLKASFDEQLGQLMTTTGFTDWGSE